MLVPARAAANRGQMLPAHADPLLDLVDDAGQGDDLAQVGGGGAIAAGVGQHDLELTLEAANPAGRGLPVKARGRAAHRAPPEGNS
jgi:hypothetical protein